MYPNFYWPFFFKQNGLFLGCTLQKIEICLARCQRNGKGKILGVSGEYKRVKEREKGTVDHQAKMKMVTGLSII